MSRRKDATGIERNRASKDYVFVTHFAFPDGTKGCHSAVRSMTGNFTTNRKEVNCKNCLREIPSRIA